MVVELIAEQAVAGCVGLGCSVGGIEAHNAAVCSEPQIAVTVLEDVVDHIVGEAIFEAVGQKIVCFGYVA